METGNLFCRMHAHVPSSFQRAYILFDSLSSQFLIFVSHEEVRYRNMETHIHLLFVVYDEFFVVETVP